MEILGLINVSTFENEMDIVQLGEGKWKNPSIATVKILGAYCYTKKSENSTEDTKTELARVDYVNVDGLEIKVEEFHRRQKFCEKCMSYTHTLKYCINKPKCKCCGSIQNTEDNCEHKSYKKFVDCDGDHAPGAAECLKTKISSEKINEKSQNLEKEIIRGNIE